MLDGNKFKTEKITNVEELKNAMKSKSLYSIFVMLDEHAWFTTEYKPLPDSMWKFIGKGAMNTHKATISEDTMIGMIKRELEDYDSQVFANYRKDSALKGYKTSTPSKKSAISKLENSVRNMF